jgi:hypothetical protein
MEIPITAIFYGIGRTGIEPTGRETQGDRI